MSNKVYFISGGGTGGHIYPAITVAEELLNQSDTDRIFYIGNPENLEYEIVKRYPQIEFLAVRVKGMPRKISFSFIKWVVKFLIAYIKSIGYIKRYKPDAIFTTGGYVSAPIVFAAITLKHRYMIHDCDSEPGLVSKAVAPFADIVSIAFENSKKILKSKRILCNGNPVREVFLKVTKKEAREKLNIPPDRKVIFAMGGSQGAKTINDSMVKIIKVLSVDLKNYVILQTGKKNYEEVITQLENIYPDYKDNENIKIKANLRLTLTI